MAAALLFGTGSFYFVKARYYEERFFPNAAVNGIEVEGLTPKEAAIRISQELSEYELAVISRGGRERIKGEDIGLKAETAEDLKEIVKQQNPYAWGKGWVFPQTYTIPAAAVFEEELLQEAIKNLTCFKPEYQTEPEDARISPYIPQKGYEIIPEVQGKKLDEEKAEKIIRDAVLAKETQIDLVEAGCYLKPEIAAEDEKLNELCAEKNRLVQTVVTYQFGDRQEILDGDTLHQWIETGEDGSVFFRPEDVAGYVSDLASKYNTAYTSRYFQTSYGPTVKVSGSYGWKINETEEAAQLMRILEEGDSQTREPVYEQKAASYNGNDYGDTYAEVNLTAQHMFFYQDGKKVLESDFVSGNVRKNYTTPPGIFGLTYKQQDAVLKGEGYASPVDFWMPFNGGIGFHDASWRSSFGGSIYKTNGSHGCINMPYDKAKDLYERVYTNVPVICYNLEGTQSKKTSDSFGKASKPQTPAKKPQASAAEPQPPVTKPQVPPDTQPTLPAPGKGESIPVITPADPGSQPGPWTPAPSETLLAPPPAPSAGANSSVVIPVDESSSFQQGKESSEIGPGVTAPAVPDNLQQES